MASVSRFNIRTAYEKESETPFFSRSSRDPLASWRISGIKGPIFEQWYFDSISNDGKTSFCMIFGRDASYAALGHGHLRMEFDAVFPDGTHFNHADWMSEAKIEDASDEDHGLAVGEVKALWTAAGKRYSFRLAADGSWAEINLQGQDLQGSFVLHSQTPAHYTNGKTQAEAGPDTSTELCPKVHLVQVIPNGTFKADLKLRGRPLVFDGIGGHMHVWAEGSWFDTVRSWKMTRAIAGHYRLSVMQWTSLLDGKTYTSGFVADHGEKCFGTLDICGDLDKGKEKSATVRWEPTNGVGASGPHKDNSTGARLRFKSTSPDGEYNFEITHQQVAFSVNFGGGESGLTGFHSTISGGKLNGGVNYGVAFVNVCVLPQGWTKVYFFLCMILAKLTVNYVNILGINT